MQDILAHQVARQKPLVVLVDDAHLLARPSLALLAELATSPSVRDPAVVVMLAGNPAFEEPAVRAWRGASGEDSVPTCRLVPLIDADVRPYVEHRTHLGPGAIPDATIQRIAKHTGGVPGLINALCDRVMALPSSRLGAPASADTVDEVAKQLGLPASASEWDSARGESTGAIDRGARRGRTSRIPWRPAGLVAGALLAAGLLVYYGPGLVKASRGWISSVVGTQGRQTAQPEGASGSRQAGVRRGATSSAPPSARAGKPPAPASSGHAAEQRVAGVARDERSGSEPRAATAARPAPRLPSPDEVKTMLAVAQGGQVADVERLLARGVPADVRDPNGFTPLMLAVANGHVPVARALLDGGASANARNRGGITPMMVAVINDRPEAMKLLLDRGADVNAQSGTGWSALTFAAWKGDPDMQRILLSHGANPAVLDKQRWTPLDYAAGKTRPDAAPPDESATGSPSEPKGSGPSETASPPKPTETR